MISTDGTKWVGDFRGNKPWNLSLFDKKGKVIGKWVNGDRQYYEVAPKSRTVSLMG